MKKNIFAVFFTAFLLIPFLLSCNGSEKEGELRVIVTGAMDFVAQEGDELFVKFYELSDGTIDFVKVKSSETTFTCVHSVSADGSKYSNEFSREFWFKGKDLFEFVKDEEGQWVLYKEYSLKE
ncbi:MAG: MliC family protein [Treponemataceae bacterium]